MFHFISSMIVASFLVGEGRSFLINSAATTLPLQKTRLAAFDDVSGGFDIDSLQKAAENFAAEGESQLSDTLASAAKLLDIDVVELGNQADLQIPTELIVPFVGGAGLVFFASIMSSLFSGSQGKGNESNASASKAAAKQASADKAPVSESPSANKSYDVSIPYDAAARLAYKNMLRQQSKTPQFFFSDIVIDEAKFAQFKVTYEEEAVKQVVQKKLARERELVAK